MSAILGRLEFDGKPVSARQFVACFEQLRPYGPDLSEYWLDGSIGAGRHLLRVSPAADNEKFVGPREGVAIVADAILDNRSSLAADLGLSADQLSSLSDTDLIHKSYLRWGSQCVDRLLGDFAFAALCPARREVFLARDHVGSRPLYWTLRNQTLIFSTSIAGIVSFRDFNWSINDRTIAEYLVHPLMPVSAPFFKDVHALAPGSHLSVRQGRVVSTKWWRPSFTPVHQFKTRCEVVDATRTLLEKAVADRTLTTGEVGSHLSGGIDSSGVTVLAARALKAGGRSLRQAYAWSPALSIQHPDNGRMDERRRIAELAASEGISVKFGTSDGDGLLEFIRRPMELEGEADLADEIPLLQAARIDNVRVMLSGWGGDEAFSAHGRGYLANLLLSGNFSRAKAFARVLTPSQSRLQAINTLVWNEGILPMLPRPLHGRLGSMGKYFRRRSFISRSLMRKHAGLGWTRPRTIKSGFNPNLNLKAQIFAGHINMRMETWAAWSAPHNFQYRYPLTDRRLLEFLFTLPPEQLYLDDQPRGLARAALSGILPNLASKSDIANERLRRESRELAWHRISDEVGLGDFDGECRWLDMSTFKANAASPTEQNTLEDVAAFAEVFAATRIWHLHLRTTRNGWLWHGEP